MVGWLGWEQTSSEGAGWVVSLLCQRQAGWTWADGEMLGWDGQTELKVGDALVQRGTVAVEKGQKVGLALWPRAANGQKGQDTAVNSIQQGTLYLHSPHKEKKTSGKWGSSDSGSCS
ncbi:hypothetical protein GGR51DRAFT_567384 [Nemania sp. FL0031]|nr:hypothetical protein GGR51DRAFT_567384 [Nemania sp. FL0031]